LAELVKDLPIGTNLALLQFLWMLVSGALHESRGALFPALQAIGLSKKEVRRAWAAFRGGAWHVEELLEGLEAHVEACGQWKAQQHAGYYAKSVDMVAYWRPRLKGLKTKHYHSQSGKALPAVVFGLIGRVGSIGEQRTALLTDLVRSAAEDPSEAALQARLVQQVACGLADDEMPIFDAGFKISELQRAGLPRFVVRLAKNFTARRNCLPEYSGKGRPNEFGERVRPLPRTYRGEQIAATPPDRQATWQQDGLEFRAEFWDDLVLPELKPGPHHQTFTVAAVYDPRFEEPWLLACPFKLSGQAFWGLYHDRWPIEQLPQAAKHMVGAHRQFVSAEESRQRLPELSLLAGSILTYLAASLPPIPTGFWDRNPKRTPGRLRRLLARYRFSDLTYLLPCRIRKKASVSDHLPKGVLGHRRVAQPIPA
jgi:hypothetical protein